MTTTVIRGIARLLTNDASLGRGVDGLIEDAVVVLDGDLVAHVGERATLPEATGDSVVEADGRCVIPGFVDSHSHLVFAGDRSEEFVARAAGRPYGPGGIRATVAATRAVSSEELTRLARARRTAALLAGTTTMESKSGYGLSVRDERRSCVIAGAVADAASYLGAHVVAPEFDGDRAGYVALAAGEMLEACAAHVSFVDAFVEEGAFDADEARAVLEAGLARGLRAKVHANQLREGPGVQLAVELGAVSADHCTYLSSTDVDALASSGTVATLLPITEFATKTAWADARRLLDAGARVALASNCNPGSGYSSSMHLAIALAVREYAMSPAEALRAATAGGAAALGRDDVGTLRPGARADVVLLDAPDPAHLAYRPGMDLIGGVWCAGERVR